MTRLNLEQHVFPTLVHLLRSRAVRQPNDRALSFLPNGEGLGFTYTYAELDARSRAVAVRLRNFGLLPGARVLLLCPPGLDYVAALMGCLYAGMVAVPGYTPELARLTKTMPRLISVIKDAQAEVVLISSSGLSPAQVLRNQAPNLQFLQWCPLDELDISLAAKWQQPLLCADSLALLQYTSGSTSSPRGSMVTHGNLMNNLEFIRGSFNVSPNDTGVIWLPPYHDMGLIGGIMGAFYCGNPLILMPPVAFLKKPLRWLETISNARAVISGGPNFAYDLCVKRTTAEDRARLNLSSWAVAFTGAEPVRAATIDSFVDTFRECGFRREAFFPCYGLAETTLMATGGCKNASPFICRIRRDKLQQNRIVEAQDNNNEDGSLRLVGCGRSPDNQKTIIVNPYTATICPPNEAGEIWISGPSVVQGYWNRPEETTNTFHAFLADTGDGPYLRTGDLGFLKSAELFITGRLKDLIICDGRNHYAEDIEQTVEKSHPALYAGNCAAFSVDVDNVERLVIMAEISRKYRPAEEVDQDSNGFANRTRQDLGVEVRQAIRRAVTESHDLRVYKVILLRSGDILKTSSGKIQRHACRSIFLSRSLVEQNDLDESY